MATKTSSQTAPTSVVSSTTSLQWHLNPVIKAAAPSPPPSPASVPVPHPRERKKSPSSSSSRINNIVKALPPPTITTEGASPTTNFSFRDNRGEIRDARDRRRRPWRKLLWVRQNFADNHTDATFLESLQRNVNVRAYDFWPLVSDSTVIIQHVSSVVIFITTFIAIFTDKADPQYVALVGTALTICCWLIWDEWGEREEMAALAAKGGKKERGSRIADGLSMAAGIGAAPVLVRKPSNLVLGSNRNGKLCISRPSSRSDKDSPLSPPLFMKSAAGLGLDIPTSPTSPLSYTGTGSHSPSPGSTVQSPLSPMYLLSPHTLPGPSAPTTPNGTHYANSYFPPPLPPPPPTRWNRRLSTLKSAILIYATLLGLSPILKSLTMTTTRDSIWALSSWLFLVNLLCFDYGLSEGDTTPTTDAKKSEGASLGDGANDDLAVDGAGLAAGAAGGGGNVIYKKLPTSLSTTTALTASVVLASRLPSTSSVFFLLLFSIQVFGLFPIFRRRLRHLSPRWHITLTMLLVVLASLGVTAVLGWRWAVTWFLFVGGGGGGAAWWLMGMQRYKNEIGGPWDPAKPVFRRRVWME